MLLEKELRGMKGRLNRARADGESRVPPVLAKQLDGQLPFLQVSKVTFRFVESCRRSLLALAP